MSTPTSSDPAAAPDDHGMQRGTQLLLDAVGRLADDAFAAPSLLPAWNRSHLIAHLASNAEALTRLCSWAATGVEARMYASQDQRAAEIESGATASVDVLRRRLGETADTLRAATASMPPERWTAEVVTAQGRTVPATEILWLRAREVWLHGLDLDAGLGVDALPRAFSARLVPEVARWRSARGTDRAITLVATDDPQPLPPVDGVGTAVEVRAPLATLAAWLTGRGRLDGAPDLQPWI